jgi:hypothetical protein
MKSMILENKTGFETSLPFDIFDNKGLLFYSSEFTDHIQKGEKIRFNLPAGIYNYNGSFISLPAPVRFKEITLPMKERNLNGISKRYQIIFGDNPNKCTIFYDKGVILFDSKYKNEPLYIRYGIYFHELGHHFYKTEEKADLYACKKMLDFGFNPSQVGRVGLMSLSNSSFDRKEKIVKTIKNL